jgi:DNA-binding transcriptional ArsR family regulator
MSLKNPLGDFEITDPQAMRALAHPVRLAALSYLQRNGPATATQLSTEVGASPSVVSWHLRHLAGFGLVVDEPDPGADRRKRWWRAVARGVRFEMPDNVEGRAAGRMLRTEMMTEAVDQIGYWLAEIEPVLDEEWSRVGGSSNTRVRLTPDEAGQVEDAIEHLLAPYVTRADGDVPAEARGVRAIRFMLPEPADGAS